MFTKIDELLWTDLKYKKLSDDGKFLFIYVLTCQHRNILGLYFLPIPYGSFDLGWNNERFIKGLRELLRKGFIKYDFDTNIIFIKNFLKHNPLENPNQVKGAVKALKAIPPSVVDTDLMNSLKTVNKPLHKPLLEQLDKRLGKQVDVDVEEDVDIDEDIDEGKEPPPKSNYKIFKDHWNSKENLKQIRSITSKRRDKIKTRLKEVSEQDILNAIDKASESKFCIGENDRNWKITFDWLVENDTNIIKVLEGKYDDKEGKSGGNKKDSGKTEEKSILETYDEWKDEPIPDPW